MEQSNSGFCLQERESTEIKTSPGKDGGVFSVCFTDSWQGRIRLLVSQEVLSPGKLKEGREQPQVEVWLMQVLQQARAVALQQRCCC